MVRIALGGLNALIAAGFLTLSLRMPIKTPTDLGMFALSLVLCIAFGMWAISLVEEGLRK